MNMNAFENQKSKDGFTVKLWRGERMCLLGFDVEEPEPDFVGFAIECKAPGPGKFEPLNNRLNFRYDQPVTVAVNGDRQFPSTEAPFQKFRWIHFPFNPRAGTYTYRVTKMHMPKDDQLRPGTVIELDISLSEITYDGFLDVGFTRNFASSQAFRSKFPKATTDAEINSIGAKIIPANADDGLDFEKMKPDTDTKGDIYKWLGFEARDLIFGFLEDALKDKKVTLDVFTYDFNEPDMLDALEKFGPRLRAIMDDSTSSKKNKKTGKSVKTGHGLSDSAESQAALRFGKSAGASHIKRTHFQGLQHHKVLIARRDGVPFKVLGGSTNFSFRGIYIQANNVLVFDDPDIAGLYGNVFDAAFTDPDNFKSDDLAGTWHAVNKQGRPPVHLCFSPHKDTDLSLNPVRGAIDQATSSVLYAIAFLNQIKSGPTKEAVDRVMTRQVFSYGISDKAGGLALTKPDGSIGLVDFKFLAAHAPEPFKSEWSGGKGINIHHKFVITDFNLPTAKVFVGSSNLSPAGEAKNGDHLIMIEDRLVATSYAIEALRVFDHLHFRTKMKKAKTNSKTKSELKLQKPVAISHAKSAWFDEYYVENSQKEKDRKLFSA
jgi:phosphatidylserine/phosphatidylglycerophosphate/cardiolipin synthase-like enzyme